MKILITLAGLLAGAVTAASGVGHAALAQPPAVQTVAVHYGDLDLGSAAGRSTLDHRIRHAIRTACGEASPVDLEGRNLVAACRADLTASLARQRDLASAAPARRGSTATLVARR
jgi:UrcA family protein